MRVQQMRQLISYYRKQLAICFGIAATFLILQILFPPDIHGRLKAIRRMQTESYQPGANVIENLNARRNYYLDQMFSSDKPGQNTPQPPAGPLDELPEKFNVESYFEHLNRLRMASGYSLDYAYYFETGRGFPLLYARPEKSVRLIDQYDFEDKFGELRKPEVAINAYMEHIRTDGSREGFIQLAVLRLVGEQFYLYWHAHYKDTRILTRFPAWVSLSGDQVAVSLLIFTKWGGVKLYTMKVKRNFPHSFISESDTTILPYSCGIRF